MAFPSTIDRYQILGEIGRGAMGTVYRAHDPRLDREVAVKTISGVVEEGTQGDELTIRFEREARVAARLRHPNVVAVHDAGRDGDRLFLVLELVEGESLGNRLARGDFPSRAEALEMAAQAADALAAAHAAGIIHRDVKPGNLLLARDGRVLMTDFGIAKALGETSELTRTGMVVGSPAYLSPEQVQGLPLDGRSDLFSLGVVLFEMLLRRKPFAAETFTSLVYQILTADPLAAGQDLQGLPPALAELLREALAKDREHRIPDARLFAAKAREIARALPELGGMSAPTMVLESGTAVKAPRAASALPATIVPIVPRAPIAPPAPFAQSAQPAVSATAPTAFAPTGGAQPARSPWLALALGALAVAIVVAALLVVRAAASRPAAPATGAPPAVALVDSARPLAQPAPPTVPVSAPASEPAAPGPAAVPGALPSATTSSPASSPPAAAPFGVPATVPARAATPRAGAQPFSFATPSTFPPPPSAPQTGAPYARPASVPEAPAATPRDAPAPAVALPPTSATFETQSAAEFHVSPEETLVTINGARIGIADDWDGVGGGKEYVFPAPGIYIVRLDAEGYKTAWVRVVVRPEAKKKVVDVDTDLEEVE